MERRNRPSLAPIGESFNRPTIFIGEAQVEPPVKFPIADLYEDLIGPLL